MAYTAQQLVTRALYLSGIVAREAQVPSGQQITDGLAILNSLLDFKQIETDLIPYYTYIEMAAVPQQEYYFLPYVADIESITFNIDTVRYPMVTTSRRFYYGSARVDNVYTLPFNYNYNRALGGGNLALYFIPDKAYPLKIMTKIFLVNVELNTDLTNVSELVPYTFINSSNQGYDTGYIEYLRYELAAMLCEEYGILFNPEARKRLDSYKRTLMYVGPPDLTLTKLTILNSDRSNGYTWADASLGYGWRP